MKRLLGLLMLASLVTAGLSCGGHDATASGPGTLNVRLTSPNSGLDSAIVVTISGPAALTSATAGTGLRLFQQPLGGMTTRFALTGLLTNGATILTIGVSDLGAANQYSGSVDAVALPNYQVRSQLGGYALAVTR
jgi:hypothetical protein